MKTIRKLLSLFLVLTLLLSLSAAAFAADAAPADPEAGSEADGGSSGSWIVVLLIVLGGILVLAFLGLLVVKKFSDAN